MKKSTEMFPDYISNFLKSSAGELNQNEILKKKARTLEKILQQNNIINKHDTNIIKHNIQKHNHIQIRKFKNKIISLCKIANGRK